MSEEQILDSESGRAEFQKNYLVRYGILAGFCILLALWFAYDGFIGYPSKLPAAEAYDEIRDLEAEERFQRWEQILADNPGFPEDAPEKSASEINDDIVGQYFWSAIFSIVGIPALVLFFRSRGSWVEPTEDGLTTSWGQKLKFADVTRLNKRRWKDKGIAKATYIDGDQTKTFVFDDFKFEREPIGKMLRDLEAVLERDNIVGGPTEVENDEEKARQLAEEAAAEEQSDDSEDS